MIAFYKLILWFLWSTAKANSNEITTAKTETGVVNLALCESSLPPEEKKGKKTLEEVHTYAELKHDPRASLPDSFTVCSSIMTAGCQSWKWPTFFNILDNNGGQFLGPYIRHGQYQRWTRNRIS